MAGRTAAAPRGPRGPWLCLLVAFALDIVRGQREGQGGARGSRAQTEAGDEGCSGAGSLRVLGRSPEPGRSAACPEGGEVSPPGSGPQPRASVASLTCITWQFLPGPGPARSPGSCASSSHPRRVPAPSASFPSSRTSNLVAPCLARTTSLIGRPESCSPVAPSPLPSAQNLRDPHCLPPAPRSSLTLESPGVAPSMPY